jgi:murein DD-endopeptidase MepM/ murein hydrolase activator NlpD
MSWFIGGTLKNMVDVFATFLKLGFDAKEKFDSIAGDIKKNTKGIDKVFDNTLNPLKAVFTGVIQLTNSFLAVSVKEDELNEAKTQLAKEQSADNVPPLPPLPKADVPQTPPTSDPFPKTPPVQKFNTGGVIRGYNEGGRINPRTPITRGVESQRREVPKPKPIIQPQKTAPGKDVGGDKKVKQLYDQTRAGIPDFIPLPSFFRSDKKSGFAALMGASEEYKKPMTNDILGIGNMMGASVDSALGQKIEKKSYTQFADGIKYLVNYGRTQPKEFAKIDLEDMVRKIVEPRVNMAINRIQEEINKKSAVEVTPGPGGGMEGGGAIGTIDIGGFSPEDVDALGRMIQAESGSESALGKAGVLAVILNRYRLIKSGTPPSQFNISGKTSEQVTIRDILFAGGTGPGNQFSPYKDGSFERTSSAAGKSALAAAIQSGGNDPQKFKDNLISSGLSEADADYVIRSVSFSNARTRSSRPFNTREVAVGNHVFQHSPNIRLTGQIGAIDASVTSNYSAVLVDGGVLPSTRIITSYRGWRWGRMHRGVDYAGPGVDDQPISVIKPGKVVAAGWDDGGGGFIVVIDHTDGATTKYFHLKEGSMKVKVGENIVPGQVIGIVGNTGRSTGTHLHFEIWKGGKDLDNPHKLADGYFRFGGNVKPTEVQKLAKKGGKEGYINPQGTFVERRWAPEEKRRFENENIKKTQQPITQAPRPPELQRITQTPKGTGHLVNNKMYYFDINTGVLKDDKNKIIQESSNEWKNVMPEILRRTTSKDREKLRKKLEAKKENENNPLFQIIKGWQNIFGISSTSPTLPAEKYTSYNQPRGSQEPVLAIQPVIISNQIPVPVSSGAVAFLPPRISSSKSNLV